MIHTYWGELKLSLFVLIIVNTQLSLWMKDVDLFLGCEQWPVNVCI